MNTVEIGDKFESKSLDIIKKMIEEEQLGHLTEHIKIFRKKEYYSSLRKKNIKFDLTIEVWPPGANRYVLLYIIECKDYDKRVPVSKIEDFHSKILQVAGVNVKGVFISNSPLQEGGFNIAESTGMMVIEAESSEDYKIILHRKSRQTESNTLPFITDTHDKSIIDTGVEHIERLIDKKILSSFQIISSDNRISFGIDKLSKEAIEKLSKNELEKIDSKIFTHAYTLSTKKLTEYLKSEYKVSICDVNEASILGSCDFNNNSIGLNTSIRNTNRELFILAHEFGHYTLHQRLSIGQTLYNTFNDSELNFKTGKHDLNNPKQWIEWQANYFATSLVLPKAQFLAHLWKCQDKLNKSRGIIFLDDQYQNIKDFNEITKRMAYLFNVSKTSIIYRLKEMELINNQSRLKSIGKIIEDYKKELFI
ncbi:ImmA/IrrE family metallo-endopeptidase [Algoriphagus resistens]|uniref:ImmA/IrrE family metallo-endopeptidase n=1 Tax=Algoriphagus resistens TaxID=1750590 RepID=UPI0007167D16|nr:ImmA/IrrE family metallo-endopeptidase [Algoriphagus resistens]